MPSTALTGPQRTELLLFYTLLELAVIILAGRVGGTLARRFGQSTAVGEIIIGILLGPSLFGWLAPGTFDFVFHSAPPEPLQILSGLGLVLLLFQIGMEFDFAHLTERRNRGAVIRVSAACLCLPFASGLALGFWMASSATSPGARVDSALFVATAFSITALPILGRILIEPLLKIRSLDTGLLAVGILIISTLGAYAFGGSVWDVIVACLVGVLGYTLYVSEIPLAPVVLGMVIGPLFEINLRRSLIMSDGSWAIFGARPTALTLIIVSVALLVIPLFLKWMRRYRTRREMRPAV